MFQDIPPSSIIVIGLSGGPDSIYLLHKLVELSKEKKLKLIVAHLDHQWRPNSADDLNFCKKIAQQFNLPFESALMSDIAPHITPSGSKEADARSARRYFLEKIQRKYTADAIALAHHTQDQQENFFIRLIRGASLDGLIGMKEKDGPYIRPLLHMDKKNIVNYLDTHTISYLTDPSNQSDEFLRNRVRSQVIPVLNAIDPRFEKNFATTLARLKQANEYMQREAAKAFTTVCTSGHINRSLFFDLDPYLQQRVILQWLIHHKVPFTPSYRFLQEILRFLRQPESKEHQIHSQWKIVKKKESASIVHI